MCERIVEVQYRDWLVGPALKKDGTFNKRKAPQDDDAEEREPNEDTKGEFFHNLVIRLMFSAYLLFCVIKERHSVVY